MPSTVNNINNINSALLRGWDTKSYICVLLLLGTHTNSNKTTTTHHVNHQQPPRAPSPPEQDADDAYDDLDALQQRHQSEKQQAALIRQNIGSGAVL